MIKREFVKASYNFYIKTDTFNDVVIIVRKACPFSFGEEARCLFA